MRTGVSLLLLIAVGRVLLLWVACSRSVQEESLNAELILPDSGRRSGYETLKQCANEMAPAFFPNKPHTRQEGCYRAQHTLIVRRKGGLLCTSRHWESMWRGMCFSCTGWMPEDAQYSADASSAMSCSPRWRVCRLRHRDGRVRECAALVAKLSPEVRQALCQDETE